MVILSDRPTVKLRKIVTGWYIYDTDSNEYSITKSGREWRVMNFNKILNTYMDSTAIFYTLKEVREYITDRVRGW